MNTLDPSASFVTSSWDFKQPGFNEFPVFQLLLFKISDETISGRIYKFTWVANLLDCKSSMLVTLFSSSLYLLSTNLVQ